MKIAWQDVYPQSMPSVPNMYILREAFGKHLTRINSRPDTSIAVRYLNRSTCNVRSIYLAYLNTQDVIEKVIQNEKDGYDATIVGSFDDPGLQEARQIVEFPVVGPGESSMHIACMLGSKFAIVTNVDALIPKLMRPMILYGMQNKAISHRPIRASQFHFPEDFVEGLEDPHKSFIPNFEKVAKECIRDGADVIVLGCTLSGMVLSSVNHTTVGETGVPIVDPTVVALKMAECLVDMKNVLGFCKSKANHSLYAPIDTNVLQKARKIYGLEKPT